MRNKTAVGHYGRDKRNKKGDTDSESGNIFLRKEYAKKEP